MYFEKLPNNDCKCTSAVRNTFFNLIKSEIKADKLIIKIDTQSFDELILSLIPMEIIKKTVLINYELTSIDGIKKPKVSENEFKKRI